jgi:hypothetical protein
MRVTSAIINSITSASLTIHPSKFDIRKALTMAQCRWRIGALSGFEDPTLAASEVPIFWDGRSAKTVVSAHCSAHPDALGRVPQRKLSHFSCEVSVFAETGGSTHILLQRGTMRLQLLINGPVNVAQTLYLSLDVEHAGRAERVAHASRLLDALSGSGLPNLLLPSTQGIAHLRHYVIALDGHLAGRSYRDIAEVLYGADRIGPYWTDDTRGYKSKVRRAVERGIAMMNGGYRALL